MAPRRKRAGGRMGKQRRGNSDLPISLDALFEVLLPFPAKELCRLRLVCRAWRALLSDPHFIAAHAARHPGPLIVASWHPICLDCSYRFDIVDLSGQVLKQFRNEEDLQSTEAVISAQLDLVCIPKGRSCILHNPATGSSFALPEAYAEEHAMQVWDKLNYGHLISFGQIASTVQYKVLRVVDRSSYREQQLCEVFTFDGGSHARWRGKKACPGHVGPLRVVIKGIVYFLLSKVSLHPEPIHIASFDLGTEDWRAALQGPMLNSRYIDGRLSVTSLNDC